MTNTNKSGEYVFVDRKEGQEVRVRKTVITKSEQESTSSRLNENYTNYFNALVDRFFQLSPIVKFASILIFSIIILLTYFALLHPEKPPSPFFREFANTTRSVFEEINSVDLPAADSLTQYTVSCRSAANLVQNSPAFKDYGPHISSGLRNFGEKITEAGRNLQKMYNKGTSVYNSFDTEIEAMMARLTLNLKHGEARYFKNKLNKLINKIKDFRQLVEQTLSSIHDAEEIRHDTEGYILNGIREAEKFISNNDNQNPQHTVDLTKAQSELAFVNNLMGDLSTTAVHLDRIRKVLITYEDKLLDAEAELNSSGRDEDGIFEVTREDLKYLKQAVEILKSTHDKFRRMSN